MIVIRYSRFILLLVTLLFLTACSVSTLKNSNIDTTDLPESVMRLGFEVNTNTEELNLVSVDGVLVDSFESQANSVVNPALAFSYLAGAANTGNCGANAFSPIFDSTAQTIAVDFCFLNNTASTFDHFEYRQHVPLTSNVTGSTHNGNTLPLSTTADAWEVGQASFDDDANAALAPGEATKPQEFIINYTAPGSTTFFIDVLAVEQLTAGDIAIIGANADNNASGQDEFYFVALTDIPANTTIYFTDSGWTSAGSFRPNEGAIAWKSNTNISRGTVIQYVDDKAEDNTTDDFVRIDDANVGSNGFSLTGVGDQIFAFVGSTNDPTFIFAITLNSTVWGTDSTSTSTTALPTGLVVGTTAVAVGSGPGVGDEFDNSKYDETLTVGTKAVLLSAIAEQNNWDGSNAIITPLAPSVNPFTVN